MSPRPKRPSLSSRRGRGENKVTPSKRTGQRRSTSVGGPRARATAPRLRDDRPVDPSSSPLKKSSPSENEGESSAPVEAPSRHERLNRFLADAGIGSRRQCDQLIASGRVTVNNEPVADLGLSVDLDQHVVRFDGEIVRPALKQYWWINKPRGVLSTSRDPQGRRTVLDLLPPIPQRVYAVGRLDADSIGLMLLTNDGELALRLTHPRYGVPKTYQVLVAGRLTNDALGQLRRGVWLAEGKVRPLLVKPIGVQGSATKVRVVLNEGQNREIRRLFARVGHKVMQLERTAIGRLKIRRLPLGQARPATREEIALLREEARRDPSTRGVSEESSPRGQRPRSTAPPKGRRARFITQKNRARANRKKTR